MTSKLTKQQTLAKKQDKLLKLATKQANRSANDLIKRHNPKGRKW